MHKLDAESIRLIGSTEVVQSPVSVVKELTENALDAGATRISIRLENFGLDVIEITDNASGIAISSMPLIGQHHCTSKVTSLDDLAEGKVDTYGFRGEALASIAAVTGQLTIATCCPGEPMGRRYTFDPGSRQFKLPPAVVAMQSGTVVTVSKLFQRLPVRRDYFAKSKFRQRDILSQCRLQIVAGLSICKPGCRFSLKHGGSSLWETSQGLTQPTLLALIGGTLVRSDDFKRLQVDSILPDHNLEAYLPAGNFSPERQSLLFKSSSDHLFLSVNKRPIIDKDLALAVKTAYADSGLFAKTTYPIGCVKLSVPRNLVDNNVDVAKWQIHLGAGKEAIANALQQTICQFLLKEGDIDARQQSQHRRRPVEQDSLSLSGDDISTPVPLKRPKVRQHSETELSDTSFSSPDIVTNPLSMNNWSRGRTINEGIDQPVNLLMPERTRLGAKPNYNGAKESAWVASLPQLRLVKTKAVVTTPEKMANTSSSISETTLSARLSFAFKSKQCRPVHQIPDELIALSESRPCVQVAPDYNCLSNLKQLTASKEDSGLVTRNWSTETFSKIGLVRNCDTLLLMTASSRWKVPKASYVDGIGYEMNLDFICESIRSNLIGCSLRRLAERSLFESMTASVQLPKRSLGHNFSLGRYLTSDQLSFLGSLPSKPSNPPLFRIITDERLVSNGFKLRLYSSMPQLSRLADTDGARDSAYNSYVEVEQAPEFPDEWAITTPDKIGPMVVEIIELMMATGSSQDDLAKKATLSSCRPRRVVDFFRSEVDRLLSVRRKVNDPHDDASKDDEYLERIFSAINDPKDLSYFKCPHGKSLFSFLS